MNNFLSVILKKDHRQKNEIEITREYADKQIKEYAEFLDNELIRLS